MASSALLAAASVPSFAVNEPKASEVSSKAPQLTLSDYTSGDLVISPEGAEAITTVKSRIRKAKKQKPTKAPKSDGHVSAQSLANSNEQMAADASEPFTYYAVATPTGEAASQPVIVDTAGLGAGLLVASARDHVDLSWSYSPRALSYSILRDGRKIAEVTSGAYRDIDVAPGKDYSYSIIPVTAPVTEGRDGNLHEGADESTPTVTDDAPAFTTIARTPTSLGSGSLQREAASLNAQVATDPNWHNARVTYRAFIPEKVINIGGFESLGCSLYTRFNGNNRGYTNVYQASSKIDNETMLRWSEAKMFYTLTVEPTRALRADGSVAETRTAGIEGSGTWQSTMSRTYAKFTQKIEGGNPFCRVGAIKGEQTTELWSNGTAKITGEHRLMPNIESYAIRKTSTGWVAQTLYTRNKVSAGCLVPFVPNCVAKY